MLKIAFDIGCNIGKYTEALLNNGYDRVVAVDPNPNLLMLKADKVSRVLAACSDKVGVIPFYFANADTISSASIEWVKESRFSKDYQWASNQVKATTIDNLVLEFGVPYHIKIDVEGYEETALRGMTKKYAPEICFEWAEEQGDSSVRCVEYLYSLGYVKFGFLITDPYMREPDIYYSLENFKKQFVYDKQRKDLWGMIWAK